MLAARPTRRAAPSAGAALFLLASLSIAACGGGPKLTNLRCRQTPCQDPEDPFKLRLSVDFSDDTGTLSAGVLELLVNDNLETAVTLADLFNAQGLRANATQGTLQVDEEVALTTVTSGEAFTAGLRARNGGGQESNAPQLSVTISLGR